MYHAINFIDTLFLNIKIRDIIHLNNKFEQYKRSIVINADFLVQVYFSNISEVMDVGSCGTHVGNINVYW